MSGQTQLNAGAAFDRLFDSGGSIDPHPLYRDLRARQPVFWSDATQAWVLTRHQDVRRLISQDDHFAVMHGEPGATIHGTTLLQMRGEEHRRKTGVVAREIRNLSALEGKIRTRVEKASSDLLDDLDTGPDMVELRSAYTSLLPLTVIAWLLGMDSPDELKGWYRDLALAGVENIVGDEGRRLAGLRAVRRFEAVIEPVINTAIQHPGVDVLSALATWEHEGIRLPFTELRTLAGFLLTAGVETTDRTLTSLLYRLARNDQDWLLLREEPELINAAIAETLRIDAPVQGLGRVALEDTEFNGVSITSGERLLGLIGSANRDEAVFDDPDRFDVARFANSADRQFTPAAQILSFSMGPHHCTGPLLARLELTVALRDVLARFESLELHPETPLPSGMMLRSPEELHVRAVRFGNG